MAYQLIYTSAPRALEAGRSGFGTVARHRAISSLLVSAIERASQFSRLPGISADRVIFCHRILTVAGGRFHVLSSIRDAGADYTGRTNHIAHHLVIDPREISQLGAAAPSPAEVLQNMHWATAWNEAPRFFDDSEVIHLANLSSQARTSAWAALTGSSNQAGHLATGDAIRGAYLIHHPATDLRQIFAESLRLVPDRLWQIAFTTSLQPSDEISDFRWIGVEDTSPLRTQAEISGRVTLNLANPSTLPLLEFAPSVRDPAAVFTPKTPEPSPEPDIPTVPSEAYSQSPASALGTQIPGREFNFPAASFDSRGRTAPPLRKTNPKPKSRWHFAAVLLALLVTVGFAFQLKKRRQQEFEAQIDLTLNVWNDDYKGVAEELKREASLKGPGYRNAATTIAKLTQRSLNAANESNFEEIRSVLRDVNDFKTSDQILGVNFPTRVNELLEHLRGNLTIFDQLGKAAEESDPASGLQKIEEIWPWPKGKSTQVTRPLEKLRGSITAAANKKRANLVHKLLMGTISPPEKLDEFKSRYKFLTEPTTETELNEIFRKPIELLHVWERAVELSARPDQHYVSKLQQDKEQKAKDWPKWLTAKVEESLKNAAETLKASVPDPSAAPQSTASGNRPAAPAQPVAPVPEPVKQRQTAFSLHIEDWKQRKALALPAEVKDFFSKSKHWMVVKFGLTPKEVRLTTEHIKGKFVESFSEVTPYFEIKTDKLEIQKSAVDKFSSVTALEFFSTPVDSKEVKPAFTIRIEGERPVKTGDTGSIVRVGSKLKVSDKLKSEHPNVTLLLSQASKPDVFSIEIDLEEQFTKKQADIATLNKSKKQLAEKLKAEARGPESDPDIKKQRDKWDSKSKELAEELTKIKQDKTKGAAKIKSVNESCPEGFKLFPDDGKDGVQAINSFTGISILEEFKKILKDTNKPDFVKTLFSDETRALSPLVDGLIKLRKEEEAFLKKRDSLVVRITTEIERIESRVANIEADEIFNEASVPPDEYGVYAQSPFGAGFKPVQILTVKIERSNPK